MQLSIISDGISKDFNEAIKFGVEWGIKDYEIRHLNSGRVPYVSDDEVENIIKEKEKKELNISTISPGLFKISLSDEVQLKLQIEENIYESFRFADRLDTRNVVIFGFKKYVKEPPTNYNQVVHILGRMTSLAEKYGFILLLENAPGYWANTGENTAKILNDINSKNLKANWDLANAASAGEIPYPYGYLTIRKQIRSIYINDFRQNENGKPEYAVVGDGVIDWKGQFRAIMNDKNIKYLTIETHGKPSIDNSHRNLLRIINLLEDFEMDESFIVK